MALSEYERRRLAAMMPSIVRSIEEVNRQRAAIIRNVLPTMQIARQAAEAVEGMHKTMTNIVAPQLEALRLAQNVWTADLVRGIERLRRNALPPNVRPLADDVDFDQVLDFVENEGIPLYLIPRTSIAKSLLTAKDRAARRAVMGRHFDSIVSDCVALLDECASPATTSAVRFMRDGRAAIRDGHLAPAQALFTNVLDTLLQTTLTKKERETMLSHKAGRGPQSLELELREAYVMLPIWRSYESYWQSQGDPIPTNYSRHASAHGVSSRQYSKRNTVQALMLATSYVGFVNGL